MRPAITKRAARNEMAPSMTPPTDVCSWPPTLYVSLIRSFPDPSVRLPRVLLGAWALHEGVDSLEDLLVDDEDEAEHEEREDRQDGHPHEPVPALPLTGDDPALYRRQPEGQQEEAARRVLVEALMEDGVTVTGEAGAI